MKVKNVYPYGNNLLVEVALLPDTNEDGIYEGTAAKASKKNIEYYYGTVLSLGDTADADDQAPGLKKGDQIVFSQFAGHHIKCEEDMYTKLILGHDVVAILKDMENITKDNIVPTGDRILVEIINESLVNEDGIYNNNQIDSRDADTQQGLVIDAGTAKGVKKGDIVLFDPYCGNLIVNEADMKLKTVNIFDILTVIK